MTTSPTVDLTSFAHWLTAAGISLNTIGQRIKFVQSRQRDWGRLDQPPHVVAGWLRTYHGWTHNTYLNHLRSVYAWMLELGAIDADPTARIRRAPRPALRPQPIGPNQLGRALDTASGDLRSWILLGALAGMRCHEIAKIHGSDITEHGLRINGKGGVIAMVPTHPDLWTLAQTYPRDDWWFPSPQHRRTHVCESLVGNRIRAHLRTVGITSGSAHRLRHTYCTNLSRAGVRPRVLQELMRHASLETTMRYDAVDDDERTNAIRLLVVPSVVAA